MVRPEVARAKIARAVRWLEDAARTFSLERDEFLAEPARADLAIFYLFLTLQECLDLAAHWVADAGWTPADDTASTFDVLAERDAIDTELAVGLKDVAGLRNRIAHGYALLDRGRIHDEFRSGEETIRRFLERVATEAGL